MGFLEDFQESLESLLDTLKRNYSQMGDLDKSLQDVQQRNMEQCKKEIDDIKRRVISGNIPRDTSNIRFSDGALEEQQHCIRICDKKLNIAKNMYDMVDEKIQELDQYIGKVDQLRQVKEATASGLNADGSTKSRRASGSSRGGRKITQILAEPPPPAIKLDLPVFPNEPTYCSCKNVSYGQMIACDNPNCKIEWFHFKCVGLEEKPKGKWYCLDCTWMRKCRKGK